MTDSEQGVSPGAGSAARAPARHPELSGPAGRLEALYVAGADPGSASYAAVVCHPHPLFGGTLHNKVVYHAAKVFEQAGLPVLRFNFRGAGASEGTHDAGIGEQEDLSAALSWLAQETGLPLLVAGFSFGAWVSLRTCCAPTSEHQVRGLIALGLPIEAGDRSYSYEFLAGCSLPKLFISGARDGFGPVASVEAAVAAAAPPRELVWVPDADHFFAREAPPSGLAEMQAAIRAWLDTWFLTPAAAQASRSIENRAEEPSA